MNNFTCIYKTFDTFEANLIKSLFDEKNIACILKSNDASGVLPHLGMAMGGTEIYVHEDNLDECEKILEEFFKD